MPPHLSASAIQLLTAQANVIATWQVDRPVARAMRGAHNRGQWRQLTRTTFAAAPSAPTHEQRLWAAALHAGPDALLSGQAALSAWGWTGEVGHPLDVLVPASRNPSAPPWICVHRSAWMPGAPKRGIPRARADCACLDAAGWARTDREAMFIVVTTLQERLVSPAALRRALADRPTLRRRAQILETVEEYAGGAMSMGEQDFTRLCRKYGIRKPDRQVRRVSRRGTRRIDAYFDAERVVVEIDGIGHVKPGQWMDDHERQNDIVIQGDRTFLRVSTWVLRYEPESFMEQLRQALHEG